MELEQQATPPAASAAATDGNHAATVCALARVCGWQALESLSKEMLVEIVLLQNQEQQAAPAPAAQRGTATVAAGQ